MRKVWLGAVALALTASAAAGAQDIRPAPALPPVRIAASATLRPDRPGPVVSRYIFSQFAEHLGAGIYGGIWVGPDSRIPNTRGYRNDVVAALRALKVPLIRWPGGCFADTYHWRDGIGPRPARPARINSYWDVIELNSFGTHEFMALTELIGADAYVNGNVGSSHPGEMAGWLEYMTARDGALAAERARNGRKEPWRIAYWGIGNELWGCGGQMRGQHAADLTRQFGQFLKVPGAPNKPLVVASGANDDDYAWTETMMRETGAKIDALALHYYTIPDRKGARGSGTRFDEAAYARTLAKTMKIDELVTRHAAIMDRFDPAKRVELDVDEWGILVDVEPGHDAQSLFMQNSLRDAILASLNFDVFIRHADRVRMTAIAQMVNVAQAMVLTDGPRMILTPTYHVYRMYAPFQGATALPLAIETPRYAKGEWSLDAIHGVAARDGAGHVHLALTNTDANRAVDVRVALGGLRPGRINGRILTAAAGVTAHNDFDTPDVVAPAHFTDTTVTGDTLTVAMPPHSVVVLDLGG